VPNPKAGGYSMRKYDRQGDIDDDIGFVASAPEAGCRAVVYASH